MNPHDTDQLGQRLANLLGEPALPAHLQARLRSARAQALARKGAPASASRVGRGMLAERLEHPFLVSAGALLMALAVMFASTRATEQLEFDWRYHVQAEAGDLVDLEGSATVSP